MIKAIVAACAAMLLTVPAVAQPGMGGGPGMGPGNRMNAPADGAGPGQRMRQPTDCARAADPAACAAHREARQQAAEACRGLAGPERQSCLRERMSTFDCAKARNPEQCRMRMQAYADCKGRAGPAFHQCVQQRTPAPECAQAADPRTCELHRQVREACRDKFGPEHRACVQERLAPSR